jgi:hypothetical protein
MTRSTRITTAISIAYVVLAFWMSGYLDGRFDWRHLTRTAIFFAPIVILWGWWFYKKYRRY